MLTAEAKMNNFLANQSDAMIKAAVVEITNKASISSDDTVVRAALLSEYERRHGGDAVDSFMVELGLM